MRFMAVAVGNATARLGPRLLSLAANESALPRYLFAHHTENSRPI